MSSWKKLPASGVTVVMGAAAFGAFLPVNVFALTQSGSSSCSRRPLNERSQSATMLALGPCDSVCALTTLHQKLVGSSPYFLLKKYSPIRVLQYCLGVSGCEPSSLDSDLQGKPPVCANQQQQHVFPGTPSLLERAVVARVLGPWLRGLLDQPHQVVMLGRSCSGELPTSHHKQVLVSP
jgi:hypothetical protein